MNFASAHQCEQVLHRSVKSMRRCLVSHQHGGEQLMPTAILEQPYINGHRNSHVTIFLESQNMRLEGTSRVVWSPFLTKGRILFRSSLLMAKLALLWTALGVQQREAFRQQSTSVVLLATCAGSACAQRCKPSQPDNW